MQKALAGLPGSSDDGTSTAKGIVVHQGTISHEDNEGQAIRVAREQWRISPSSNDPWKDWSGLRTLLRGRFDRQHRVEDLEEIIQTDLRLLINASMHGSELQTHATRLSYLAVAYGDREKISLSPSNNARALYFRRLALAILPEGLPLLTAAIRSQLALNLLTKANEKQDRALMDAAVRHAAAAFASHLKLSGVPCEEKLDTLANVLHQRFIMCEDPADLDLSIKLFEMETKLDIRNLSGALHNLSYALSLRYELSGKLIDLNRAIELGSEAFKDPAIALESMVDRVRNLVRFLEARFLKCRDEADIQRAKESFRYVIDRLSPASSRIAGLSFSLSHLLRICYETRNRLEDLELAIDIARKGSAAQKPPARTARSLQSELALLLVTRYRRLGQTSDAYEGLEHFQAILNSTAADDISRCIYLSNMACTYDDLYRSTNRIWHLEEAYKLSVQAMACADVKLHPYMWLNGANRCIASYMADDSQADYFSQGMMLVHQGLGVAQKWRSDEWAQLCTSAGIIYELRYRKTREADDFGSADYVFRDLALQNGSSPKEAKSY